MPAGANTGSDRTLDAFLELYADYKAAKSSNRQLNRDVIQSLKTLAARRNVKLEGLACDGATDDGALLNTLANVTMQPNGGDLDIVGIVRVGVNTTLPSNVNLTFRNGALLQPDAGITVRINGKFDRGPRQKFSGAGTVTFGYGKIARIRPQWWGGKPDITGHEDSTSIRSAIAAAAPLGASQPVGTVWLRCRGEWLVTDVNPIIISSAYTRIYGGDGQFDSNVRYEPGQAGVCFKFEGAHAGSPLYGCGIEGITFVSGNASYKKTGVQAIDVSSFKFRNNFAPGWIGAKSTVLSYAGRDMLTFEGNHLYADRPFEILSNAYALTLAADHLHMNNNELVCRDAAEYCLTIGDNVGFSSITIRGFLAWAGGRGAVYYVPTVAPGAQLGVAFEGFRYESPMVSGFYAIEMGAAGVTTIRNFSMRDCQLGGVSIASALPLNKGLKLRGTTIARLDNILYSGEDVALDVDNSCRDISWDGFETIFATVPSIIGANLVNLLSESVHGGAALPTRGHLINTADVTNPAIKFGHKINLAVLAADPANLNDGDVWMVATGLKYRKGGITVGPVT